MGGGSWLHCDVTCSCVELCCVFVVVGIEMSGHSHNLICVFLLLSFVPHTYRISPCTDRSGVPISMPMAGFT